MIRKGEGAFQDRGDRLMNKKEPYMIAVSGVKNSGKTTLITKLIPIFGRHGLKTAVIKHDGHEFEPDVPGTDSFLFRKAGACACAVVSDERYMIIREGKGPSPEELSAFFPEADIILLEGYKFSNYPKVELIRKGNSSRSVCGEEHLLAVITDLDSRPEGLPENIPVLDLNDPEKAAEFLLQWKSRSLYPR